MKKGFTLIELLAVIVILAIIALIATPIILNIIEDSKKSAITNSVQLYVDGLTKHIAKMNLENEFNPTSCTITNGNITCDGQSLDYTVDGQAPTSGTITLDNGAVTGYTLGISGYTVTKSNGTITLTKGEPAPTYTAYTMGQLLQYDPVNNTSCTTGDTCYKWRVITVGDTTSNSTITLQMDHNLVNLSAWVTQTDYNDNVNWSGNQNHKGPITALKALEIATSTWDNSLKLNYTYDTSLGGTNTGHNYGTLSCANGACTVAGSQITSNLKARMITGEEISALTVAAGAASDTIAYNWNVANNNLYYFSSTDYVIGTETYETGSTALSWLIENTGADVSSGATANTYGNTNYGYWTLSPNASISTSAWYVTSDGRLSDSEDVDPDDYHGTRPVITLPKSIFE